MSSQLGRGLRGPEPAAAQAEADVGTTVGWLDRHQVVTWIKTHQVWLGGVLLVAASIAWKTQFLYRRYFYQDDFFELNFARRSPFSWHYLGWVSDDHFFPGVRAITWVLARVSVYNWALDATVLMVFAACAGLAALRLLRTLFGDRPAILLPLVVYLLLPLTVPDLGWWWTGMESPPFQFATFMTLNAHVLYVRTGRGRHLGAAIGWLAFGLLFFDKAVFLPVLLFAITSAFLVDTRSWASGVVSTMRLHRRAWLSYGALLAAYAVVAVEAFRASKAVAHPPTSASEAGTFVAYFVKDNLLPGIVGGPWHWLPAGPGHRYAIALPSATMITVSAIAVLALLAVGIWIRPVAWRAWLTFALWVVLADVATVIIGRLGFGLAVYYGLETRYLADAAPVLAICLGLAVLPVAGAGERASVAQGTRRQLAIRIEPRFAAAAAAAIFVVSAIWSDQAYENVTNGGPVVAAYMANASLAVTHAAPKTFIIDRAMPYDAILPTFGSQANQSQVVGALATGSQAGRLHWITQAVGTIDNLRMFAGDGELLPALISGVYSVPRKGHGLRSCWPYHHGQIVVKFARATTAYSQTLRINYIWGSGPAFLVLQYGDSAQRLYLTPGLHSAYLQVAGAVTGFAIDGWKGRYLCVGIAAAGRPVPY